jgi:hypothetical protein
MAVPCGIGAEEKQALLFHADWSRREADVAVPCGIGAIDKQTCLSHAEFEAGEKQIWLFHAELER